MIWLIFINIKILIGSSHTVWQYASTFLLARFENSENRVSDLAPTHQQVLIWKINFLHSLSENETGW